MVREAKIEKSYSIIENEKETLFSIKQTTLFRLGCGMAMIVLLPFIFMISENSGQTIFCLVLVLLIGWAVFRWTFKKKETLIKLDADGITSHKLLYRWENIKEIGRNHINDQRILISSNSEAENFLYNLGYQIYVLHGERKIPIIGSLHDSQSVLLYQDLILACKRYGYNID